MGVLKIIWIIILFELLYFSAEAQSDTLHLPDKIAVVARPYQDSIVLRWAPKDFSTWIAGNKTGYHVERITVTRNGNTLNPMERVTLTANALTMLPYDRWEALVKRDRYAAIAAQAFFGGSFQVDLAKTDAFSVVNKAKENEQRFSFALFSADMSVAVAKASGLMFTDKAARKNEKYLYRIRQGDDNNETRGSVLVGVEDGYISPAITNFSAQLSGDLVRLRWDRHPGGKYVAYIIERSSNGKDFISTSETPIVDAFSNPKEITQQQSAIDTIDFKFREYLYRVRGITVFGEVSEASEIVKVQAFKSLSAPPSKVSVSSSDNRAVDLRWEFPDTENHLVKKFIIKKSKDYDKGFFVDAEVVANVRNYLDKKHGG
jgi:hypothetical protein